MNDAAAARRRALGPALVVAAVAFLPFLRGTLAGHAFYFRDLARHFFPLRLFALTGLRQGELRHWNPLTHEGEPLALPALGYPLDLLGLLRPDEVGLSLLLALHVPLAALGFLLLARRRGLAPVACAGGALAYALSGFALSTLNLYVFLQALAWAPLVVLGLIEAAEGGRRELARGALVVAVALSTTAVELVAQAALMGLVLGAPWRTASRAARAAGVLALGAGLAAFVLLPLVALASASDRASGFAPEVVLSQSVHPFAWLQVVAGGLFGDPAAGAGRYWGQSFWPLGFPYVRSLYLGPALLALALTGASCRVRGRWPLLALALVAAFVCLGRWAGLEPVVAAIAPLRSFRFPVKAFFTIHAAVALLAALGLDALASAGNATWRRLATLAAALGALLLLAASLPGLLTSATQAFAGAFFPPDMPWPARRSALGFIAGDAAGGGAVAMVLAAVAVAVARGRLACRAGLVAAVALAGADLLRHGAGLNPMVTPAFYALSPEMSGEVERMRAQRGRLFTCDVAQSPTYLRERSSLGERQEAWSFALLRETLTPERHLDTGLATALSLDLTMLSPRPRVASPDEASCRDIASFLPRLRRAGVRHVISLDPLPEGELRPGSITRPAVTAPVAIRLYTLPDTRAREEIAGGSVSVLHERTDALELEVESRQGGRLLVRSTHARGWQATVEGRPAPVTATAEGHLAIEVPPGRSHVRLRYRPPLFWPGVALSGASALFTLWLARPLRGAPGKS
jgi:hypothetical protein